MASLNIYYGNYFSWENFLISFYSFSTLCFILLQNSVIQLSTLHLLPPLDWESWRIGYYFLLYSVNSYYGCVEAQVLRPVLNLHFLDEKWDLVLMSLGKDSNTIHSWAPINISKFWELGNVEMLFSFPPHLHYNKIMRKNQDAYIEICHLPVIGWKMHFRMFGITKTQMN
jgi:hypothetical protein